MRLVLKRKKGFTLIEVVLGIVLLATIWIAAVNVMISSRATGSLAKHKAQAINIMQEAIEAMRKRSFAGMSSYTMTLKPEGAGPWFIDPAGTSLDTNGTLYNFADDPNLGAVLTVTVGSNMGHYRKVDACLIWNESFFGRKKPVMEYCGAYISDDSQAN
jgi:prepilin-type N-terminal cleavage/methylation domain-containing protein